MDKGCEQMVHMKANSYGFWTYEKIFTGAYKRLEN